MSKYVLVKKWDNNNVDFVHVTTDDYTNDLNDALIFESEYEAQRERIDDEQVAKLITNEDGFKYEIIQA